MKTREEIKNSIVRCRKIMKIAEGLEGHNGYIDIIKGQIRSLRWVLCHKLPIYYWCPGCERQHRGVRCHKCGGDIPNLVIEKYLEQNHYHWRIPNCLIHLFLTLDFHYK